MMELAKFYSFDLDPLADTCWSIHTGPDGRIYAAACCEHTPGGQVNVLRYNDETDSLDQVVNIARVVDEPWDSGRATQCKIHYSFAPSQRDGILYAATHLSAPGYGRDKYSPWSEWKNAATAFPASWLVAYDVHRDEVAWTSEFIPREGCRCLALDEERARLYAISYPRDHFWIFDLAKREIRSLGRLGSVNSQAIFTDRRGRVFTSNDQGQIVRYDPDSDTLEELPVFVPHNPSLCNWHNVLYDVVSSPDGECVYGVPWAIDPHLFRYWPEDGPRGRMEDLGPVHQDRDRTALMAFGNDHCGGLVFGADGMLYYGANRWPEEDPLPNDDSVYGVVVQMDTETLERHDVAHFEQPGRKSFYVSRGARDRFGNLFFGMLAVPFPAGIARLPRPAEGDDLHEPLRTWG